MVTKANMKIRKSWCQWMILLFLLTGCLDIDIATKFEEDGSGTFSIKAAPVETDNEYVNMDDIDGCIESIAELPVEWSDISYREAGSLDNPNSNGTCVYTYQFSDLGEAEKVYKSVGMEIQDLYIDERTFFFKISNRDCKESGFDDPSDGSIDLSVELPGRVNSHNADRFVGEKLTWKLLRPDCFDAIAESKLSFVEDGPVEEQRPSETLPNLETTQPNLAHVPESSPVTEENETSSFDEFGKDEGPLNAVVIWTTIGASVATMIGTLIAYTESKRNKTPNVERSQELRNQKTSSKKGPGNWDRF